MARPRKKSPHEPALGFSVAVATVPMCMALVAVVFLAAAAARPRRLCADASRLHRDLCARRARPRGDDGLGGIISFGQAAFLGIGAYASAWWTTAMGGSPFVGLAIGLVASGVTAAGSAPPPCGSAAISCRSRPSPGASPSTTSSAIVEALGSHNGIAAIPPLSFGAVSLVSARAFYYFAWPLLGVAMLLLSNLLDSRQGRAIRALRGGNALVESLGIDPFRARLCAFVLAALLASLAGWLYAHFQRVVSSTAFDLEAGIEFLLMALVGGASHVAGAAVGAGIVTLLKEGMQSFLPLVTANSTQLEAVVLGALFIFILQKARFGLVPLHLARHAARAAHARLQERGTPFAPRAETERHAPPGGRRRQQALRRPRGGERCWFRGQRRGNHRPHRPERRRQDHALQPRHRPRLAR